MCFFSNPPSQGRGTAAQHDSSQLGRRSQGYKLQTVSKSGRSLCLGLFVNFADFLYVAFIVMALSSLTPP